MMFGLDIDGFLLSTQFLSQLALLISTVLSALVGEIIAGFFGAA